MLTHRYDPQTTVLTVTETMHSATRTKVSHWHYNLTTWHKNADGKEGSPTTVPMDESSRDWVRKHYFPKVGLDCTAFPA